MPSHNDPTQGQNGKQLPPPSFTPSSGRPGRPERTPAIEIGSPDTGQQPARRHPSEPPTITDSQKIVKIRRSPGMPPTVTPRSATASTPPVRTSSYAAGSVPLPPNAQNQAAESRPNTAQSSAARPNAAHDQLDATRIAPAHPRSQQEPSRTADTAQGSAPSFAPRSTRSMPAPELNAQQTPRRISGNAQGGTQRGSAPTGGSGANAARSSHSGATGARVASAQGPTGGATRNRPGGTPPSGPSGGQNKTKRSRKKIVTSIVLVLVALMVAWPLGLLMWADGKLQHVEALSGAPNTPGTTYLIAGSDSRGEDSDGDIKGARADTIMLLHVPEKGPKALISLPRDIYVPIPGRDANKINASFSYGGAPLLVETVEQLTNLTVDHYVELGFDGVKGVVDAVGGVELCLDYKVNDKQSELKWDEPGCKVVDGDTALAFARMRKADPLGDIGRAERQRQVVSAVAKELKNPAELIKPGTQIDLINAGTSALVVSEGSGFMDLGKMALAFLSASSDEGITGTPPILSLDYRPGGVGSAVQLDEEGTEKFFKDIAEGTLKPGEYNKLR